MLGGRSLVFFLKKKKCRRRPLPSVRPTDRSAHRRLPKTTAIFPLILLVAACAKAPKNKYHRHGTVSWILAKAGSPDRFVASPLLLLYPTVRYPTVTIWAAWSYAGPSSPRPLKVAYHVADTSIEVGHRNEPEVWPAGGHPVVHETPVRPTPCSFLTERPLAAVLSCTCGLLLCSLGSLDEVLRA